MPLLMEGFGGSIWSLALAHTSEGQALGTPAPPAWHALSPEASPVLHLGESASAEASPLTHRGLPTSAPLHLGVSCKGKHSVVKSHRGEKGQFSRSRSAPCMEHTRCDGPSPAAGQQDSASGCLQLGVSALESATHSGSFFSSLLIYSAPPRCQARNATHSILCEVPSSPYEAFAVAPAFWKREQYPVMVCNLPAGTLPIIGTNGIQTCIYLTSKL